MPIEIHLGASLFPEVLAPEKASIVSKMQPGWSRTPQLITPPPSYTFTHDLESLWWIIVWIVLVRVKGMPWLQYQIFCVLEYPHPDRQEFFKRGVRLEDHLPDLIHDTLCDCRVHIFLSFYSALLCQIYVQQQEASQILYCDIWGVM